MDLKVPAVIASKQDVNHAHRELRVFSDLVMQSIMRHDNPVKYPAISAALRAVAVENQVDLRDEKACQNLMADLETLKDKAPAIHISFPSEPTPQALQKIVAWLRKEVDPKCLIQVGLQPTIAAGVIVRTPNRQFDFSLRRHLMENRSKLIEVLAK